MRVEFKSNCAQVFTVYSKVNGESDTRVDLWFWKLCKLYVYFEGRLKTHSLGALLLHIIRWTSLESIMIQTFFSNRKHFLMTETDN